MGHDKIVIYTYVPRYGAMHESFKTNTTVWYWVTYCSDTVAQDIHCYNLVIPTDCILGNQYPLN